MSDIERVRKRRFLRRRIAAGAALGVLACGLVLVGLRSMRSGALPNVEVAGAAVGSLEREALEQELTKLARARETERIVVTRPPTRPSEDLSRAYERHELGYSLDVAATADRVLHRGRQLNPVAALLDQVRASFVTIEVAPVEEVDEAAFDSWAGEVSEDLAVPPREGDLRFTKGEVSSVMPRPGVVVDEDAFLRLARKAAAGTRRTIQMPIEEVAPAMSPEAVVEAAAIAREVLSEPVTLRRGDAEIVIPPRGMSRVLDTRTSGDASQLEVVVDVEGLEDRLGKRLSNLERDPVDAGFRLEDGSVEIVPAKPGFVVDHERLARRLVPIATSEDRLGRAPGEKEKPDFTTRDARKLNIDEQVSTFTTEHSCCEPRVDNIHRIADIIDGTVVKPGESFSVNDAVGERTRAKGFVAAPAIFQGEYVDEVGGGISQFATTMFNAIFFGGYELTQYKAHSYYISRYPMGREATLAWPSVDLAFRNDSDAGVYIDTSYTDTSITVTFYGKTNVNVASSSGEPHNYKDPPTQCKKNASLAKGERNVVQEGKRGFDIVVRRIFRDSDRDSERFFTRYLPEPRIVERRSCS